MTDGLKFPPLPYTAEESDRANAEWKACCGHHSIAAACGLTLDAVRKALPHEKGWMSPTNVATTLHNLGIYCQLTQGHTKEPSQGINRIQFEGKWLNQGVPARVAYFQTHWIGVRDGFVLDTVVDSCLWIPVAAWRRQIGGFYCDGEKRTGWHITHKYRFGTSPSLGLVTPQCVESTGGPAPAAFLFSESENQGVQG